MSAVLASALSVQGDEIKLSGSCPAKDADLPKPWTLVVAAPKESFIYNSPHFRAPFSQLGIDIKKSTLSYGRYAFVSVRLCGKENEGGTYATPCEMMDSVVAATKRGSGFNNLVRTVGGLNFGYRNFWPSDKSFVGLCDGVDYKSFSATPMSFCRIWMPNGVKTRGLYVVLPGEALKDVPKLMSIAKIFLDDKYRGCAIANYWGNKR